MQNRIFQIFRNRKKHLADLKSLSEIKEEKEYKICDKTISGKELKKAILAAQDNLMFEKPDRHNELVGFLPKVEALIAKVDNVKDIPQDVLDISEKYNYPIIMM